MKILKMRANFGKLSGDTLELSEGLNIIHSPNESGKSTWCAFIRCMLYGVDRTRRTRGKVLPDKLRYLPWNGSLAQGEMEILHRGEEILLTRNSGSSAMFSEFSAVYAKSQATYPLEQGSCGETLTTASEAVFAKTAFVAQNSVVVENSPDLESKIAAIISTGDEANSYSEIDSTLRKWQRVRAYNKSTGIIPELMAEREALADVLDKIEKLYTEQDILSLKLERLQKNALPNTEELEQCEENEREARAMLDNSFFGAIEPEEASKRVETCRKNYKKLQKSKKIGIFLTIIFALVAVASWLGFSKPLSGVSAIFATTSLIKAAMTTAKMGACAENCERETELKQHKKLYLAWRECVFELEQLRADYGEARRLGESEEHFETREKLAELRGKISAMGDAVAIKTKRAELKTALEENYRQYSELELAREMLAEADRQQQESFSPKLTVLAEKYFKFLSGGRYEKLKIDRELSISAQSAGEILAHEQGYLSEGARTLMYLSLRLALCELTLAPDCPIILDDVLCSLDDERCARTIELLNEFAKTRQVILFTCRKI